MQAKHIRIRTRITIPISTSFRVLSTQDPKCHSSVFSLSDMGSRGVTESDIIHYELTSVYENW